MDSEERTILHWASSNGDIKLVQERILEGDDINSTDDGGWTPLISASSCGHIHIVALLLENGAKLNLKTKENRDGFFYAVSRCNMPLVDLFFQYDYQNWNLDITGSNCIHRAICNSKCSIDFLEMLKNHDAPFEKPDFEGNTLIHLACYENKPEIIKYLIEKCKFSLDKPKNKSNQIPKQLMPLMN